MSVNKDLIAKLHNDKIIDKRFPIWWQLEFEGRRIYSEKEFDKGLETICYHLKQRGGEGPEKLIPTSYKVWTEDQVPILLRDIDIGKRYGVAPLFISVKPMSHGREWHSLKVAEKFGTPLATYNVPHIRGLAIETKNKFFFWYPFQLPSKSHYSTDIAQFENTNLKTILSPVDTDKFYKNIINGSWGHGKRRQTKAEILDATRAGYIVTPYFELKPSEKQLFIYPVEIFKNKLSVPIILGTIPDKDKIGILGVGYFSEKGIAHYWNLDVQKQREVKKVIGEELGLETVVNKSQAIIGLSK